MVSAMILITFAISFFISAVMVLCCSVSIALVALSRISSIFFISALFGVAKVLLFLVVVVASSSAWYYSSLVTRKCCLRLQFSFAVVSLLYCSRF